MNTYQIKKKEDFAHVFKSGNYVNSNSFTINYAIKPELADKKFPRYGIITSKKIGNAVKRNYLKRIFRSIIRNNWKSIKNSISFEIIPKKKILNHSFTEIEKDIRETLNK